jgi:hypothetical protein
MVITWVQAGEVFSFFLILNVLTSGGQLDWRDGVETFIVTESVLTMGSAKLNSDIASIRELYGRSYDKYNGTMRLPRITHLGRSYFLQLLSLFTTR